MKKFLRITGIVLLLLVAAGGLLIAFAPQQYTMERSVTIAAPQPAVFGALANLRTWPSWTAWGDIDPTQKYTFSGTPAASGATYHWVGEEAGEGQITSTAVTGSTMKYDLDFIKPFESHNTGWVSAEDAGPTTHATMGMTMSSPRPWNAIGWMIKGSVADDFEKSLKKLKAQVEGGQSPVAL